MQVLQREANDANGGKKLVRFLQETIRTYVHHVGRGDGLAVVRPDEENAYSLKGFLRAVGCQDSLWALLIRRLSHTLHGRLGCTKKGSIRTSPICINDLFLRIKERLLQLSHSW